MRGLFIFSAGILSAWLGGEKLALHLHGWLGTEWIITLGMGYFLAFVGGVLPAQMLLDKNQKSGGGVNVGGLWMVLRPITGFLYGGDS